MKTILFCFILCSLGLNGFSQGFFRVELKVNPRGNAVASITNHKNGANFQMRGRLVSLEKSIVYQGHTTF